MGTGSDRQVSCALHALFVNMIAACNGDTYRVLPDKKVGFAINFKYTLQHTLYPVQSENTTSAGDIQEKPLRAHERSRLINPERSYACRQQI